MTKICDRCGERIEPGGGYAIYCGVTQGIDAEGRLFWSAPATSGPEQGDHQMTQLESVLYCELCANALFTAQNWEEARPLRFAMAADTTKNPAGEAGKSEVIDYSAILRFKKIGFDAHDARGQARMLGHLLWNDEPLAKRRLKDQVVTRPSERSPVINHPLGRANLLSSRMLTSAAVLLTFAMWLGAFIVYLSFSIREREKSPLHQTCVICSRAATKSVEYVGERSGRRFYYFCPSHASAPPSNSLGIPDSTRVIAFVLIAALALMGLSRRSVLLSSAGLGISAMFLIDTLAKYS